MANCHLACRIAVLNLRAQNEPCKLPFGVQDCSLQPTRPDLQDCRIAGLQIAGLQDCRIAELHDCRVAGRQDCRMIAGLQVYSIARLRTAIVFVLFYLTDLVNRSATSEVGI